MVKLQQSMLKKGKNYHIRNPGCGSPRVPCFSGMENVSNSFQLFGYQLSSLDCAAVATLRSSAATLGIKKSFFFLFLLLLAFRLPPLTLLKTFQNPFTSKAPINQPT